MRMTDGLWLTAVVLLSVVMVVSAPPLPTPLDERIALLPDPPATVDGRAIARDDLREDLRALAQTGVLHADSDEVSWQRAVATQLEARIDRLLVQMAAGEQRVAKAEAAAQQELLREVKKFGSEAALDAHLRRHGETRATQLQQLATRKCLDQLVDLKGATQLSDEELRERYDRHPGWPMAFAQAKAGMARALQRARHFEQGRMLLGQLRAAAHIVRQSPFDRPPGGRPLTGMMAAQEAEEDLD